MSIRFNENIYQNKKHIYIYHYMISLSKATPGYSCDIAVILKSYKITYNIEISSNKVSL